MLVPAGVLYTPAREIIQGDRSIPPEKLEAVLRRKLRRTGMLLSEPEVLRAMEHSALEKPCYLPIGKVTDGQRRCCPICWWTRRRWDAGWRDTSTACCTAWRGKSETATSMPTPVPAGRRTAPAPGARSGRHAGSTRTDKPRYLRKITAEEFWQTVDRGGGAPWVS